MLALFLGLAFQSGLWICQWPASCSISTLSYGGRVNIKKLEIVKSLKHNWDISHLQEKEQGKKEQENVRGTVLPENVRGTVLLTIKNIKRK